MLNKMFQNILRQYKEIVNRDIGITDDGGLILELTTRSEPELMSWVRSFGNDAELL